VSDDKIDFVYKCAGCGVRRTIPNVDREGLNSWCLPRVKILFPACQAVGREPEVKQQPKPDPHTVEIERWVPLDYRDPDMSRFPTQFAQCQHWIPGRRGLLLFGPTRRFKSRIAYWLFMRCVRNKFSVEAYDCRTFRGEVESRISAGTLRDWYKRLEHTIDVLLFDDMGKFKGEGKRIEEELFNVVKLRVEAQRGMIITTNDTPESMAAHFSKGIGQPLVERIVENCAAVDFRTEDERVPALDLGPGMDL